jgi:hypothetical protein
MIVRRVIRYEVSEFPSQRWAKKGQAQQKMSVGPAPVAFLSYRISPVRQFVNMDKLQQDAVSVKHTIQKVQSIQSHGAASHPTISGLGLFERAEGGRLTANLGLLFVLDALVLRRRGALVVKTHPLFVRFGHALFEHGLRLDGLKLGLEIFQRLGVGGRVGTAAGVGHVDAFDVFELVAGMTPIASSSTVFLRLRWVGIGETVLCKVARKEGLGIW